MNPVTARGAGRHLDLAAEGGAEAVTDPLDGGLLVGVQGASARTRTGDPAGVGIRAASALLELSDRPTAVDRVAGEPATVAVVGGQQQCPPVALAQVSAFDRDQDLVGQVEQPDQVRDRDAATGDARADLLAGEPEYLDPMKEEAPTGWVVTGYPWNKINTPKHKAFLDAYQKKYNDYP